ncbi:WYL domain-containing protein [Vibrio sp. 10N.286.49.B3]|uniref:WYL domain-containing protein n=1 Tax=Vibrio sp. 10N.286.49.B3 TaxID=1880855 RepID=UPI000C838B18|nr:WYL domain-containing protein [Vibrio sp. 10N.286.49.B3]PMH46182.1 WYL domain-containing protein [Vibrio sp. 10N.286.49.B3]
METTQDKRLRLIDFYLMFYGKVNRADLMKHGEISIATSSRAFNQYREVFGQNLVFDVGRKCYIRSDSFQPKFEHNAFAALRLFAWGIEENQVDINTYGVINSERIIENLSPTIVSLVTQAIVERKALVVDYSSSNGQKTRTFSPHSVFFGLGSWHVRGWDSKANGGKGSGRSFKVSRIVSAQATENPQYVTQQEDKEWLTAVTLSLAPHTQHVNRDNLIWELQMNGKPIRNLTTNAALAGYVLNDLRVDCSQDGILPPNVFGLQLMNRHELEDVESIQALAPGY